MLVALVLTAAGEMGAEPAEHGGMPPLVFGLIAFGVLLSLLAITWAFRSVGKRH